MSGPRMAITPRGEVLREDEHEGRAPQCRAGVAAMAELVETSLVRRAKEGRGEAVTELLRRTRPLVERTVGRLCHDRELTEDLVQSCLLIVVSELGGLRSPEAYISWVRGIVRNVCCKEVRRQAYMRGAAIRLMQEGGPRSVGVGGMLDPEEVMLRSEARAHIKGALEALPARYREVVTMRVIDGYAYEEIAELLRVPAPLVRLWHFRARQRLRMIFESDEVLLGVATRRLDAPERSSRALASAAA